MSELTPSALEFPAVDPSNFDLIVIGTGLPESVIAAAASTAGKSVLHLDPNPFYGSHFSSLSPTDLSSFLLSSTPQPSLTSSSSVSEEYNAVYLSSHPLYSEVEISPFPMELEDFSRRFCLDVSGPRVLFCADSAIDLLVKSGVSHYLDFKVVDASFIYDGKRGTFFNVPDSRKAIFGGSLLTFPEKTMLRFFFEQLEERVFTEEDLETPFVEFLNMMRLEGGQPLPPKLIWIILYAIALADYDQENLQVCKDLLKTKDGIDRLVLYQLSAKRFPNAQRPMLYPTFGHGDLPQAFCRRAAVKGCIHALRMPVAALLADKGSRRYKGVRLASGQDLFSQQLLIDPHYEIPQALDLSRREDGLQGSSRSSSPREIRKVARGICITRTSLNPNASSLSIVYPPSSLYPEQATSVRALQLGSNSAMCPAGMFVLHLSTLCDDANEGKKLLNAAINALCEQLISVSSERNTPENPEDNSLAQSAVAEDQKSALVWSAFYIQEITEETVDTISSTPSPDGSFSYNKLIGIAEKMFQRMFPGEEFFPETEIASIEYPNYTEDYS